MAILIPTFFIILFVLITILTRNSISLALIISFLITFTWIAISTEVLSWIQLVSYRGLIVVWLLGILIAVGSGSFLLIRDQSNNSSGIEIIKLSDLNRTERTLLILAILLISFLTLTTFYLAWKSPPNNFDSMTYHMTRVAHWIQQKSVRYFPTSIARQNTSSPLAEMGILHLQILSKGDQYANLIQWSSYLGSILLVATIARELRLSINSQVLAAGLAATLPMAILQSSSTQNDLVVSVFCLSFTLFLLRLTRTQNWTDALFAGLSMGLALFTKGTAYIYCAAIGLALGAGHLIGKDGQTIRRFLLQYLVLVFIALFINTGFFIRNYSLYNNPIITSQERILNESYSLKITGSNLIRNSTIHLTTPFEKGNQLLYRTADFLLGEELNNPASTYIGFKYRVQHYLSDDQSGNPLHFIALSLAMLILPWSKEFRRSRLLKLYFAVLGCLLLYSALLKWQPWASRLHTPVFLVGVVLIAGWLNSAFSRTVYPILITCLFFVFSLPYLMLNPIRPLVPIFESDDALLNKPWKKKLVQTTADVLKPLPPLSDAYYSFLSLIVEGRSVVITDREELMFLSQADFYQEYIMVTDHIQELQPKQLALILGSNDWEYPIWYLLNKHAQPGELLIYHYQVENMTANLTESGINKRSPSLILASRQEENRLPDPLALETIYQTRRFKLLKIKP